MEHYQDQDSVLYLDFPFNIDEGRECTEVLAAEEDPCIESIDQNPDTLYDVIEPSTYITLLCPSNSIELFFVAEVLNKGEALENIVDSNGHVMLACEQFLEVHYLEKNKEGKKHIHYKRAKQGTSFIHPQEVLSCFVQIDEELRMELCEYQYLMMAACEC